MLRKRGRREEEETKRKEPVRMKGIEKMYKTQERQEK